MTALTLTLPRRLILSSNGRLHWRAAAAITADLRKLARLAAVTEGLAPMAGRVDVLVTVSWPDRRRRDAPNLWPTVKALIDGGLTDSGVLSDDNDQVVRRTIFQAAKERCPRGHVRVRLELEAVDP
jgi:Holliday junction resolvase RusA-like endonuclease